MCISDANAAPVRFVADTNEYPWSAIGRLRVEGKTQCSVFLVGPDRALTAAHCLYDFSRMAWADQGEIVAIFNPAAGVHAKRARILSVRKEAERFPQRATAEVLSKDWAELTLSAPLGDLLGYLPILPIPDEAIAPGTPAQVHMRAGYGLLTPLSLTVWAPCGLDAEDALSPTAVHSCAGSDGDSGGPFLTVADGRVWSSGIHVARRREASQEVGVIRRLLPDIYPDRPSSPSLSDSMPARHSDIRQASRETATQLLKARGMPKLSGQPADGDHAFWLGKLVEGMLKP